MSAVKFCITAFNQFPDLQLFLWESGGCQLPISSSRKQTLTTGCVAHSLSNISYICNRWSIEYLTIIASPKAKSKVPVGSWRPRWRRLRRYGPRCSSSPPPPPLHPASRQSVGAPLALAPRPGQLGDRLAPVRGVIALREGKAQTGTVGGSMATEGNHRRSGSRTRRVCAVEWRSRARNHPNVRFL